MTEEEIRYEVLSLISDEMAKIDNDLIKESVFDMGRYIALSEMQIKLHLLFKKLDMEGR